MSAIRMPFSSRRAVARLSLAMALGAVAVFAQAGTADATGAGGCTFVAALDPAPGDAGSESLTVAVDQEITFWGTLQPNAQVDLAFAIDGEPYGDFTPAVADADGKILFVHDFDPGQEGEWTVTASVADTECAGTVRLTVTGEAGASPSPALPDTALDRPAMRPIDELGPLVALAAVGSLVAVADRRARRTLSRMNGVVDPAQPDPSSSSRR